MKERRSLAAALGCDRDKASLRGQLLVVQEQGAQWLRVVRTNLLEAAVVAVAEGGH